ncbi:MAG TPA: hypothetical protein PLK08_02550, partial [Phycisphaerae bacterium]|nr:hypothetical protein [Phycisphaerae bacterium]
MHIIFGLILIAFFIAALCVFGAHGWQMVRRERMLAGQANDAGLKFSREDPFEIPLKYAAFSLMRCGHGQIAYNVAYGRLDSFDVQALDFSYEIGDGFERSTHRYGVIIFAVPVCGHMLMWPQCKTVHNMPLLTADNIVEVVGPWQYCGSGSLA